MSDINKDFITRGKPPMASSSASESVPDLPPPEGLEQPKLSLYQRIEAAKAAVRARETREREEVDQAGGDPSDLGDADQKKSELRTQPDQEEQVYKSLLFPPAEPGQDHSKQDSDEGDPDSDHDDSSEDKHPKRSEKTRTLAEMAEQQVLDQLKKAVNGYQATANYCCGGSIPISTAASQLAAELPGSSKAPITSPPTVLRFDVPDADGLIKKIQFPLSSEAPDNKSSLDGLVAACAPATFGLGGEDVLDETYRKAGKLDRSQFAIDFHPHDYGIVDAISQILLPDFRSPGMEGRGEHRGVFAELYKLNIYSGPTGKFRAHVDTPRGATQFGSLVVCLPHPHEGGQLRVSHKGHSTFFDWSNTKSNAIHWAAFYSDCEHEVLAVKTGHRVTITYNLYVTEQIGGIIQLYPTADAALFPLYEGAKQVLGQPGFMKDGGVLGFYCAHQYAHTRNDSTGNLMPYALKGIDVALFSVFKSLGLEVKVRPVLDPEDFDEYEGAPYEEYERSFYQEDWRTGKRTYNDEEAWKNRLTEGEFMKQRGVITRAGEDFHSIKLSGVGGYDGAGWQEIVDDIQQNWPFVEYKNVLWLNKATRPGTKQGKGWEVAYVHMTYGNEASLDWQYSHAVIFITVPKRSERGVIGEWVD